MKKVLILYRFLPQYRVEFYNLLKEELKKENIELTLIYGKLKDSNSKKNDEIDIPWAIYRENKIIKIYKYHLLWQSCLDKVRDSDLVIAEQANSLLINYILIVLRKLLKFKFALWGHGANLQDDPNSQRNKFKYLFLAKNDHWFAYTESVKKFLLSKNVTNDNITVVNNAIDTKTLKQQYIECSNADVIDMKNEMEIESDNIAVYSGAIYNIKRIDFLIKAGKKVSEKIDDFHLLIIGAGPDQYLVEKASEKYPWLHYVGPKFGKDRVVYFKMASLLLLPGAVGLAILDAFVTETPMVTTDYKLHGPEIAYLENNKNGIITDNS